LTPQPTCIEPLLDHLVDAGEQCRRNVEAERLGSVEVEHHLDRRLHRQVGGLLAFEDGVDTACRAPVKQIAIACESG
jgi:hypothetical protein